jgi:hypothetical protein
MEPSGYSSLYKGIGPLRYKEHIYMGLFIYKLHTHAEIRAILLGLTE